MFFFNKSNFKEDNQSNIQKEDKEGFSDSSLLKMKLSTSLNKNIEIINKIVGSNTDLVTRNFTLGRSNTISATIFYYKLH